MIIFRSLIFPLSLTLLALPFFALAQTPDNELLSTPKPALQSLPVAPETLILNKIEQELKEKYRTEIYTSPAISSLMFTPTQQSLLREAKNGFSVNINDAGERTESAPDLTPEEIEEFKAKNAISSVRSISLGGIVFINPREWTIWLNKKLITPGRVPKEILDLRVSKEFVELRWLDAQENKIYPVRLRPNQTFNFDAKIFTPG